MKKVKNQFDIIDKALKEYEDFKPYKNHTTGWICDRIAWAWKFGHISYEQMSKFSDRIIEVLKNHV